MENINNSTIHTKSDDEFIFNEDVSMLSCNKELDNYMNVLSPVVKEEIKTVDLTLQSDILNSFNNCGHSNFNTVDINQYDQSSDKLNCVSEFGYDFEQECSFASAAASGETDETNEPNATNENNETNATNENNETNETNENNETVRSLGSPVAKKHKKDEIIDDTPLFRKELSNDKFSDIQESDTMTDQVIKQKDYETSNESVDYCNLEDSDMDYTSENVTENVAENVAEGVAEDVAGNVVFQDNNEIINMSPNNCYSFSNEINKDSIFCQDALKSDIKEVEHRHNECALANDFFETVENINLNISEKQNNLKEAIEKLVDVVKESDFENRINALTEISDTNSESIEQFKKKSEDCIRQCRKFETISENLIGDCINTLAQASVCYANWVGLHASDLKEIDTDLADIESFIESSQ